MRCLFYLRAFICIQGPISKHPRFAKPLLRSNHSALSVRLLFATATATVWENSVSLSTGGKVAAPGVALHL